MAGKISKSHLRYSWRRYSDKERAAYWKKKYFDCKRMYDRRKYGRSR